MDRGDAGVELLGVVETDAGAGVGVGLAFATAAGAGVGVEAVAEESHFVPPNIHVHAYDL